MAQNQRRADLISCYFREGPGRSAEGTIDDRTWTDLDMDDVFASVDRTRSSVGQSALYAMLRLPLPDSAAVDQRVRRVRALMEDTRALARVSRIMRRLGSQRDTELFRFLAQHREQINDRRASLYLVLSILPFVAIAGAIFLGAPGILALVLILVVNLVIHYRLKPVVTAESSSYEFLHRLLNAAVRLGTQTIPGCEEEHKELHGLAAGLRSLRRRTVLLATPSGFSGDIVSLLLEYIRQFFLQEVTAYYLAHNQIIRKLPEITRLYARVGEIDALVSVAALRRETPGLCVPSIASGSLLVEAEDLVHPLLPEPVANTVHMSGKGLLVTGSNMSGKSTFLRTLGVNQVLATTIGVACARRFTASPLITVTSITNRDSLRDAESHYLVEARRLLTLLAAGRGARPALLIIDEILSGTNSEERITASVRILRHLAGLNCLVVAATHDRPIALELEGVLSNMHFTHRVDGEGLEFDYRLHPGVVEAGNAFRLLRFLGYPREILEDPSEERTP